MIVETKERDIQRSASFQEQTMGLAKGSEAFVFNVLRKDLYSDPVGSLIREYTVNAQDEHRKFGKGDTPIFIQVPNHFSPELHIRDYAGGLTDEQVFNFFGNYGASDKRDSNDVVGFYGLGCKSAFAYTDSYIVKSFKDGKVSTFNIYIDETEIGKTAKISEESTTEPNGIEIIVPVKTHDINRFQQKVVSTVKFFKTKPTIKGMDYKPDLENRKAAIKGDGWEYFGYGSPTVIMGEISYPVDKYKMGDSLESWEASLLGSDIVIYVNIGDVQVTASREALQMSAKTIKTIREKLKVIKDTMLAETAKAFAGAKNLIEAKTLYNKLISNGGGYSNIIKNCSDGIKWKGEEITSDIIKFDTQLHSVTTYNTTRRSDNIYTTENHYLTCRGDTIYFDDTDGANVGYKRRARTLLQNGADKVILIRTRDKKALETLLGMPVTELASYNAVTPTMATSNRQGGTGIDGSKRVKHTAKHFVLNLTKLRTYYSAASEVWDIQDVDTSKGGVYVSIERFKPVDMGKIYSLDTISAVVSYAERAGIKVDVPIYGIKKGGDTTGLVRFDEWIDAKVKAHKQLLEDYSLAQSFNYHNLLDVSTMNVGALPKGSVAEMYATLYKKVKAMASKSGNDHAIIKYSTVNVEADKTVGKLCAEFGKKYPILKHVSAYNYKAPEVMQYIAEREGDSNIPNPQRKKK